MEATTNSTRINRHEHSVPWFWPMAAAIEFGEEGLRQFQDNAHMIELAVERVAPPPPEWATRNRVLLELDTMWLRDFSATELAGALHTLPVLIDAPYAGHHATSW